jgi:hypothetical protein
MKKMMNKSLSILLLFLMHFYGNAQVSLTQKEMLEDFDQQIAFIETFAIHKDLNTQRLHIDYEKEFAKLRAEITSEITSCDFRFIFERALNLVQDYHCSSMSYDYLSNYAKYQNKLNFKDIPKAYENIKGFEKYCPEYKPKLKLPILYQGGDYYVYSDFVIANDTIKQGAKIVEYNNQDIATYIKNNYDKIWAVRWDYDRKQPYLNDFYRFSRATVSKDLDTLFTVKFESKGNPKTVRFNLNDSIKLLKEHKREINFGSQEKERVFVFEESNTLYIGLPFMDTDIAKNITNKIDSIAKSQKVFDKVIVDVRGNPGGNDMSWRSVLKRLLPEKLRFDINIRFKYNDLTVQHYNKGKKPKIYIETLLDKKMFWRPKVETITLKPDRKSIKHKGKIYVLQDEHIYSSAGNLSKICLDNENLISIGQSTDIVGGIQREPLFVQLKNSGLIFRMEPVLDFSNVKGIDDLSHNKVEIEITSSLESHNKRIIYPKDIYEKEFLLHEDKAIQFILENH